MLLAVRIQNRSVAARVFLLILLFALASCGSESQETRAEQPPAPAARAQEAAPKSPAAAPAAPVEKASTRHKHERPMPSFEGWTLSGEKVKASQFIGKRLLLFFFNPEIPGMGGIADSVQKIAADRGKQNFEVLGIALAASTTEMKEFKAEHGLDFPIIDDSSARIASTFRLRQPLALIGVDPEGYFAFASGGNPNDPRAPQIVEAQLRRNLRLEQSEAATGDLDLRPSAPALDLADETGAVFDTSKIAGKPAVVIFFLHTCPHCHAALGFLKEQLPKIPEAARPELVAVSIENKPTAAKSMLADRGLDFFPILYDPQGASADAYGVHAGVPVILFVDSSGKIDYRIEGWQEERDPAIARMMIAKIAGEKIPMLLDPKGYTGSDVCGTCHTVEQWTWEYTKHASAYDTLVTHAAARDPECVGCHVVGFEEPGGFTIGDHQSFLEDVGCEDCHGRGGPHLSPDFAKQGYEQVCVGCHNKEHSLGFDYQTFLPRISHTAIASMTSAERGQLAQGVGQRDLLPTRADFVGSDACESCHSAEFETWASSPHAHAMTTLEEDGKAGEAECQVCHTTGYGKTGGFPADAEPNAHPDLARVGCESCHGPGSEHVASKGTKPDSILSLGDKCDSCVILKICGSCHDDANDPGFEFEVQEKIDRQRHGTIEAGTGKPIGKQAHHLHTLPAQLAYAFSALDAEADSAAP